MKVQKTLIWGTIAIVLFAPLAAAQSNLPAEPAPEPATEEMNAILAADLADENLSIECGAECEGLMMLQDDMLAMPDDMVFIDELDLPGLEHDAGLPEGDSIVNPDDDNEVVADKETVKKPSSLR